MSTSRVDYCLPITSQFMTKQGRECISHSFPCGCLYETEYASDGEIILIRLQVCSACMDYKWEMLEQQSLDKKAQLTLPLP